MADQIILLVHRIVGIEFLASQLFHVEHITCIFDCC